jgi:hypothetical protein
MLSFLLGAYFRSAQELERHSIYRIDDGGARRHDTAESQPRMSFDGRAHGSGPTWRCRRWPGENYVCLYHKDGLTVRRDDGF